MLTSILLAAAIGLSTSPAAYDNAAAHQSYQITITSTATAPETIHAQLVPDFRCALVTDKAPTWASMSGPTSFTLAPHAKQTFVVAVKEPPPGQSELVALFSASQPGHGTGASVSGAVGTALRFSEPGKTVFTPCPKPKASHNPNVRTVYINTAAKPAANVGPLAIVLGVLILLVILLAIGFAYLRFKRPRGMHH